MAWIQHCYGCGVWCRLAATALIRHLAWELSYAAGVALKTKKKKGEVKERKEEQLETTPSRNFDAVGSREMKCSDEEEGESRKFNFFKMREIIP